MLTYVTLDETGVYPLSITNGTKEIPGAIVMENVLPENLVDTMLIDGEFVKRPNLEPPELTTGTEGCQVSMTVPEATSALIYDTFTSELLAEVLPEGGKLLLEFIDPGSYQIEVLPPKPFMELSFQVAFE